jgi:POT family proton-dependent oligopeptide transporter
LIVLLTGVRVIYRHLDATFPKYMVREFGKDALYGSVIAINPLCVVIMVPLMAPALIHFQPLHVRNHLCSRFNREKLLRIISSQKCHVKPNGHVCQLIILGTLISTLSPFILALGHNYVTAICFVTTLSLGEAIWSPRLYE